MPRTNILPPLDLFRFEEEIIMLIRTEDGLMWLHATSYDILLHGIHLWDVVAAINGRPFALAQLFVHRHDILEMSVPRGNGGLEDLVH
ncbi:hypothetical protein Q7P37_004390 [Cladosporium fusiforme]